jgi:hypothetical protein
LFRLNTITIAAPHSIAAGMYNWKNHATPPNTANAMPAMLFICLRPKFMMVLMILLLLVLLEGKR